MANKQTTSPAPHAGYYLDADLEVSEARPCYCTNRATWHYITPDEPLVGPDGVVSHG